VNESPVTVSIFRMAPTYQQLRRLHFRITIKAWLRGIDKAFIAFAGVLPIGFLAVLAVFVMVQADALRLLVHVDTPAAQRFAVIAGWQGATFVLLRALREATLMPHARAFFATLPVPPSQVLRSDVLLALQGYSILWAPLAWVAFTARTCETILNLAALAAVSLCANLALLRGKTSHALAAFAALALLAIAAAADTRAPGILASAAAVAASAIALWRSYLPGRARTPAPRTGNGAADRLAQKISLGSGLAVPFLAHELRSNVLIRVGVIVGALAALLALNGLRATGAAGTRTLVFGGAAAAIALYPLPALWRTSLLTKLHFLAGQPAFVRRMRLAVYGLPALLFGIALAVAGYFDASESPRVAPAIFGVLFAGGVAAARCGLQAASWLMPLMNFVAVIVLGGMM
jgi:hypothetical protein